MDSMNSLLKKAAKLMKDNYSINEIELADDMGNKVKMVRDTPVPMYSNPAPVYPLPWPNY